MSEFDAGKLMVSVPREQIKTITLRHGIRAPHPLLQSVMGLLLLSVGYFPARHLLEWSLHGGVLIDVEGGLVAFVVVGLWMIISAMRRGYYLDVELDGERKRLQFQREPDAEQLVRFLAAVEQCYGIKIENRAT